MMWQMKKVLLVLLGLGVGSHALLARTAIRKDTNVYMEGRITGRVDVIFNDIRLSLAEKESLLTKELANAQELRLEELATTIQAHLKLIKVQTEATKQYEKGQHILTEEMSDMADSAALDAEETSPTVSMASVDELRAYGAKKISEAAAYSDRFLMPGMTTVSAHRDASLALFVERAKKDTALFSRVNRAIEALQKLDGSSGSPVYKRFLKRFSTHVTKKYGSTSEGMESEIFFKIFELLVYSCTEEDKTIADVLGDFPASYNSYVAQDMRFATEELALPVIDWIDGMVDGPASGKFVFLAISAGMERLKDELRREPLLKKLKEDVQAQVDVGCSLLENEGVTVSEEERQQPLVIGVKCADLVRKKLMEAEGDLTPDQRNVIDRFSTVNEQVGALMYDYDLVSREMADASAVQRVRAEVAQLPAAEQAVLKQSSSLQPSVMNDIIPSANGEESMDFMPTPSPAMEGEMDEGLPNLEEMPSVMSPKKMAVMLGVGVLVVALLWIGIKKANLGRGLKRVFSFIPFVGKKTAAANS